jgi:hypothetical protein
MVSSRYLFLVIFSTAGQYGTSEKRNSGKMLASYIGYEGEENTMQSVEELISQARLLPRVERLRLIEAVEASLASELPASAETPAGPYARSLALAGTMHADFHDVSSDKYAHLAEAYASHNEEP